jgi:threonine/homoserine/homoserine lactone efflux protein
MIVSWEQLTGFFLVSLVMIVVPGPGVLFVVGRALSHGRRAALETALGHAVGNYVVAAFVAVGLGTLLERSAEVFLVVKLAGALYLIWLGIQAIRHRSSLASAMSASSDGSDGAGGSDDSKGSIRSIGSSGSGGAAGAHVVRRERGWRALRKGIVVGLTNPKTYILFGAILPQFVNRNAGHVAVQMLVLALLAVSLGLLSDSAWGLAASGVRVWFARSPRRFALVGGAGGLAMIAVGVTVALTGRKD